MIIIGLSQLNKKNECQKFLTPNDSSSLLPSVVQVPVLYELICYQILSVVTHTSCVDGVHIQFAVLSHSLFLSLLQLNNLLHDCKAHPGQ